MRVLEAVLERVTPDDAERRRLDAAYEAVASRAREALDDVGVDGAVALVGSAARDTWLAGDRDIDVFLLLPEDLDRERFEEVGLDVGKRVFPEGTVDYAEHPYVTGEQDGFDVDVVPCYDVDSPADARSAVDRTPFHTAYVRERMDGDAADQVRLLKAFTGGAGVYGSELRVRGFSGYLCELLVLEYGDFEAVVEAAADWRPDVVIDREGVRDGAAEDVEALEGPLIYVDPTDPERNVAAAVSRDSLARFVHHCRAWLREPREELFDGPVVDRDFSAGDLERALDERGTRLFAVLTDAPDVVDDQLYPQLRKTRSSLVEELDRQGFDVLRSSLLAEDRCGVLLECNVARQSAVERHVGPPVFVREHAESFLETWADDDAVTGPFVDDGRYVVERPRRHETVEAFLASDDFFEIGFGADVEERFREDYAVYADEDCAELVGAFEATFARHFRPELPR